MKGPTNERSQYTQGNRKSLEKHSRRKRSQEVFHLIPPIMWTRKAQSGREYQICQDPADPMMRSSNAEPTGRGPAAGYALIDQMRGAL